MKNQKLEIQFYAKRYCLQIQVFIISKFQLKLDKKNSFSNAVGRYFNLSFKLFSLNFVSKTLLRNGFKRYFRCQI
jgi:hypothetical protein